MIPFGASSEEKLTNKLRKKLNTCIHDFQVARSSVAKEREELDKSLRHQESVLEAMDLVQSVAQRVQQKAHKKIARVVTKCLEAVFGSRDAYEFAIEFEKKRGRTEARLTFRRGGNEVDPLSASGGGAVDVAALALRLACLVLAKPQRRRLLVLDEPMKNLNGAAYQDRAGELVRQLAEEFGVQFLIVTDDDWLKVGKVVEL